MTVWDVANKNISRKCLKRCVKNNQSNVILIVMFTEYIS